MQFISNSVIEILSIVMGRAFTKFSSQCGSVLRLIKFHFIVFYFFYESVVYVSAAGQRRMRATFDVALNKKKIKNELSV